MSGHFTIEETQAADQPAIEHLLDLSFGIARRTKTSYRLREGNHAIDGLSLVIRDGEVGIAGAISFWPLRIGPKGTPALLLGPLAVHPERQNLGIGLALMREGLARAKVLGHRLAVLVGDVPYYARAGFQKLPRDLLLMPGPTDPDRFLYLEIVAHALEGVSGLVLPPHRFNEASAAFAIPHGADGKKQGAQA
ncbi:MAG: GNAT family N-acetyltransferase [Aestuariivirga sp.]